MNTAESLYEKAFYDKDFDQKHGIINMKQRVVKIMEEHALDIEKSTRDKIATQLTKTKHKIISKRMILRGY